MDLTIDLSVIVQGVLAASLLYHVKSTRDLVVIVKLHDWRIEKLEENEDKMSIKCPQN